MSHDRGHQSYHVSRAEWRLRCAYFAHSINKFKAMLSHPVRRQYTLEVWNVPFRALCEKPQTGTQPTNRVTTLFTSVGNEADRVGPT
jgi:hypothetical protein